MNLTTTALRKRAIRQSRTWLVHGKDQSLAKRRILALKKKVLARRRNWLTPKSNLASKFRHRSWITKLIKERPKWRQ